MSLLISDILFFFQTFLFLDMLIVKGVKGLDLLCLIQVIATKAAEPGRRTDSYTLAYFFPIFSSLLLKVILVNRSRQIQFYKQLTKAEEHHICKVLNDEQEQKTFGIITLFQCRFPGRSFTTWEAESRYAIRVHYTHYPELWSHGFTKLKVG